MINYNAALPALPLMANGAINVNAWMGGIKGSLTSLIRSMFAKGEQGFAYDFNDLTAEKINWRKNVLMYSEEFTRDVWGLSNATLSANVIIAPDGKMTGDKLIPNTTTAVVHQVFGTLGKGSSIVPVTATLYTESVYVKAAEYSQCFINFWQSSDKYAYFDLIAGTVLSAHASIVATISPIGGGWYRCSVTATAVANSELSIRFGAAVSGTYSFAGDGVSGIFLWGAQLNTGNGIHYQAITDFNSDFIAAFPYHALYQDAGGAVPVTALQQPVGLLLDNSKGMALGAELVTNSWSLGALPDWTYLDGVLTKNGTSAGGGPNQVSVSPLIAGRLYKITFEITALSSGSIGVMFIGGTPSDVTYAQSIGKYTRYVFAKDGNNYIRVVANANTVTGAVKLTSVKEIAGNHASQTVSASRPILGRHPQSGLRNLLTYSEAFDNALWLKSSSTVTAKPTISPDGSQSSYALLDTTASSIHQIRQVFPVVIGNSYTLSLYIHSSSSKNVGIRMRDFAGDGKEAYAIFNGATGAVLSTGGNVWGALATTSNIGNGWFKISVTTTVGVTSNIGADIFTVNGSTFGDIIYIGDGTGSVIIYGAQLEIGNVVTPYQKSTISLDVIEKGYLDSWYLKFDGIDDFLMTNPIDFTATDKVSLFAGVRKLSDVNSGIVAETSTRAGSNLGSFALYAPFDTTYKGYGIRSQGTVQSDALTATPTSPNTSVVSGIMDITADKSVLRINGVQAASSLSDQGAGNYGNYPLYIGRRGGTSLPFNGHIYSLIGISRLTTDAETLALEKAIAKLTGVTLNV